MKKLAIIIIYALVCFLPLLALALEYPFDPKNPDPNLAQYMRSVYIWGLGIMGATVVTALAIGGILYMIGQVGKGKEVIVSALTGLLLFMGAWLILYTINPDLALLKDLNEMGIPDIQMAKDYKLAGVDLTDANKSLLEKSALRSGSSLATGPVNAKTIDAVNKATNLNGVEKARVAAIVEAESSGNTNAVHTDTDGKSSYGLMQIRVGTARSLDPTGTSGLSDAQIADKLKSDPNYNMNLGTKYYSSLLTRYNGDTTMAHAAYNGGPAANNPSANCPGFARWQCQWDDNAHTKPNTGYAPTRTYIANINKYITTYQ